MFFMSAHIFACLNNYIYKRFIKKDESIIDEFIDDYVQSLMFVIYTFSTVGYGSLYGRDKTMLLVIIILEFFGIIMYGYWVTSMRTVLNFDNSAINRESERIDLWLVKLQNANLSNVDNVDLTDIREFLRKNWHHNPSVLLDNQFFHGMNINYKKEIKSLLLNKILQKFSIIFSNVEKGFASEFFANCIVKL
jgi:hypothetical protein